MFDDLDDPLFPGPRPEARAAVARRARTIKRNRTAGLVAGLTSFVLLAAGVAAGMRGPVEQGSGLDPLSTGTPTAQRSPTPSPSPSPSATTAPPRTTAPRRPPVSPSAVRPPADPGVLPLATGPGTECAPVTALPAEGAGPHPGLTLATEFPAEDTGRRGVLTITNTSATLHADLDIRPAGDGVAPQSVAVDDRGNASGYIVHAEPRPADAGYVHVRLGPGESWSTEFGIRRSACATVPEGRPAEPGTTWWRRLPAGDYRMAVGLEWRGYTWQEGAASSPSPSPDASASPTPSGGPTSRPADATYAEGTWGTAPRTVRID